MNTFQIKTSQEHNKRTISEEIDPYILLVEKIEPTRTDLLNHPVYKQLGDIASLRIFMESHIFLDFGQKRVVRRKYTRTKND